MRNPHSELASEECSGEPDPAKRGNAQNLRLRLSDHPDTQIAAYLAHPQKSNRVSYSRNTPRSG